MSRFWCHSCETRYDSTPPHTYSCPNCHSDFVEELVTTPASPTQHRERRQRNTSSAPAGMFSALGSMLSEAFSSLIAAPGGPPPPHTTATDHEGTGQPGSSESNQPDPRPGRRVYQRQFRVGRDDPFNVFFNILSEDNNGATEMTGGSFADLFQGLFNSNQMRDAGIGMSFEQLISHLMETDSNRWGTPPTANSALSSLPVVIIDEEHVKQGTECAVCMENFVLGSAGRQLPCKHMFHEDCVIPWLKEHSTCPVCRAQLPTDDPDYERNHRNRRHH